MSASLKVSTAPLSHAERRILEHGRSVLDLEQGAIAQLSAALDNRFVEAVSTIISVSGRVVVSGMGKSGHIGSKIAATLASTGTSSFFIHPAEAAHGDLGMILPGDAVILISNSGETQELSPVVNHVKRLGIPLIGISSGQDSFLLRSATIPLLLPNVPEACPVGIAPTTSTTMALALGDALAMAAMQARGFSRDDFRLLHPGGKIGLRLMPVADLMHTGDRLPIVVPDTPIKEVILEITSKSFGVAAVVDANGTIIGTITDGDLRRNLDFLGGATAQDVMSKDPKTITPSVMAEDALALLSQYKITSIFVISDETLRQPVGLVHVHDFLRVGLTK